MDPAANGADGDVGGLGDFLIGEADDVTHHDGLNRCAWDGHAEWFQYQTKTGDNEYSSVDRLGINATFRANIELGNSTPYP